MSAFKVNYLKSLAALAGVAATSFAFGREWNVKPSSSLRVEQVTSREGLLALANLLKDWEKIAGEKETLAWKTADRYSSRFRACRSMCSDVSTQAYYASKPDPVFFQSVYQGPLEPLRKLDRRDLYVCKDNQVRACMVLDEHDSILTINRMVGHPHNIRSPLNSKEDRVTGAGTRLLQQALSEATKRDAEKICGCPITDSEGFYVKAAKGTHVELDPASMTVSLERDYISPLFKFSKLPLS